MNRVASMAALAALLMVLLPTALADDGNATAENPAWVQDCPPDTTCAASAEDGSGDAKPSVACPPGETCVDKAAGGPRPTAGGPCPTDVNCTGSTNPGATCMDGQQGNETCDPNVYYMAPGAGRGPEGCDNCRGPVVAGPPPEAQSASAKTIPALGVFAVFAAFAVAVVGVARLQHRRR
jgi:hypothetical protein